MNINADLTKDIHALITDYEHSICVAKLKTFFSPPQSHLRTSIDEQRCVILKNNSLHAVQELELRERRIHSILNHGGFLLTTKPESLGMTSKSLEEFKLGLKRAVHMADHLADIAVDPEILRIGAENAARVAAMPLDGTGMGSLLPIDEDTLEAAADAQRAAERDARAELTTLLRTKQALVIGGLSDLDLAFLLTACEGAACGWKRYMRRYAQADSSFPEKTEAFAELLLREGSLVLWAFVRGTGGLYAYVWKAVNIVADQVWKFNSGLEDQGDNRLSKALVKELGERLLKEKKEGGGSVNPTEVDDPLVVKRWAHRLVGGKIGCDGWKGYDGLVQAPGS